MTYFKYRLSVNKDRFFYNNFKIISKEFTGNRRSYHVLSYTEIIIFCSSEDMSYFKLKYNISELGIEKIEEIQ